MKSALKYGLLITSGVIAWVAVAHFLVPNPCSPLHVVGPIVFFNLLEAGGIYFGIRDRGMDPSGQTEFKSSLKTGVGIAFVYGIGSCLFFLVLVVALGSKIMCAPAAAEPRPFWQVVGPALVGQFGGALLCGLIYSTIIAFFLARRRAA